MDVLLTFFCFFKQKTAYEMRISDLSSDVCSSDLVADQLGQPALGVEKPDEGQQAGLDGARRAAAHPGQRIAFHQRTEERRVGKACVSTGRSRWPPCT